VHKSITIAAVFLLAVVGSIAGPIQAAAGDLDHSFGGYGADGRVTSAAFPGTSIFAAVAQPGDKLAGVAAPADKLIAVGTNGPDFVVARYLADGALDPTFGTMGVTLVDFNSKIDSASAVMLTADDMIVVAGTTGFEDDNSDFAIARLTADGALDPTFSQDGKTTVDFFGGRDRARAILARGTGLLIAGAAEAKGILPTGCTTACHDTFGFAELLDDGSLNQAFGNQGHASIGFIGSAVPLALLAAPADGFYAAGLLSEDTSSGYVIARITPQGGLDPAFNSKGYRTGTAPNRITTLAQMPDATIIAAGNLDTGFGLLRLNADGSLLPGWGTGDLATVDVGARAAPLALLPFHDGTLAVAGVSDKHLVLAQVNEQGQTVPDSMSLTDLGGAGVGLVRVHGLALVPDVRLRLIGSIQEGNIARLVVAHHFLDGSADNGGRQSTDFGIDPAQRPNDDLAQAALFQPDGKLVVAGITIPFQQQQSASAAIARYTVAGALDQSFGEGGLLLLPLLTRGATAIAFQPDGKIVVVGADFSVVRLNPDGSLDMSFNGTGSANVGIRANAESIVLQPDGKLVVGGGTNTAFVAARFTASGVLDKTFGQAGIVQTSIGPRSTGYDLALQPDGKIIAAGVTEISAEDNDIALLRYNYDGSLDASFDGDGILTTDFGGLELAFSVAIQPDGSILVGGTAANKGAAFARYRPNGALDPSFDGDGKLILQIIGGDVSRALAVSPAGITATLCGEARPPRISGVVVRLTLDGKLDPSFNGNGQRAFRFAGADCPLGLASAPGRIAAVGFARHFTHLFDNVDDLSEDFAVMMFAQPTGEMPGGQYRYLPLAQT
jgi:uncharacterized delta-60 repeat protein